MPKSNPELPKMQQSKIRFDDIIGHSAIKKRLALLLIDKEIVESDELTQIIGDTKISREIPESI